MNIKKAKWIWCKEQSPNTYCYARGKMRLTALPLNAELSIVADSRYQVWVNGKYVGQGPTPFKRPYVFFDSFDVTDCLRKGNNVIAVMGNYHGVGHCTYTPGKPGVLCGIEVIDADGNTHETMTNQNWKVLESKAYVKDVPRRTWATAWVEYFDARKEPAGWNELGFDDSQWQSAVEVEQGEVKLFPRIVAPLDEFSEEITGITCVWKTGAGIPPINESVDSKPENGLSAFLDKEPLERLAVAGKANEYLLFSESDNFPLCIKPSESGFAVAVDFGREISGQLELELESPAGVVIDLCPSELLDNGRPWCFRKGGEYAKRYITREGKQKWRGYGYDGFRYIYAVVRGPHPELIIKRIGAWRREAGIPIKAEFECQDEKINRIWRISCHTMRIGSQEVHVDCPTREQTSAWGDHVWSGLWAVFMTGNPSALRHLAISAEHVLQKDGQMPCYAFTGVHDFPLYDYSMICIWGMWLYVNVTGDGDMAERVIPVADKILDWFRKEVGPTGLIELDCDKSWKEGKGQLFIDHPGIGWHNCPHPGIDRRGINACLNFFFVHALESEANLLEYIGQNERALSLRDEAKRVRASAEKLFYNAEKGVYVDGFYEGKQLQQISQQTNALAVTSGVCPAERAGKLLKKMLDTDDKLLCKCGTYFWTYLAEALCRSGMYKEMWTEVVRLWNDMAERGATSWWETFLGDELDSLCHIWSTVPGYLITAEILGVKPAEPGFAKIIMRPRFDVLGNTKGSVPVPDGKINVEWKTIDANRVDLKIELRTDAPVTIELPTGWREQKSGRRRIESEDMRLLEFVVICE